MKAVLALTALLAVANANFFWGSCPSPHIQAEVDLTKWDGEWFEMARTTSVPYSTTNDCNTAFYTLSSDGADVTNCSYYADKGSYDCANGKAYCEDGSGVCHVRFSNWAPWGDYNILDINYNNYLAVWSCSNWYAFNFQWAWVLARNNDFEALPTLEVITGQTDLTSDDFIFTEQSDCPARPSSN